MKQSKRVVAGLLGLSLPLLGYSVFTAVRANSLENRLQRLESSHWELEARHRALANAMLRAEASCVAAAEAKVILLRENLGLAP